MSSEIIASVVLVRRTDLPTAADGDVHRPRATILVITSDIL